MSHRPLDRFKVGDTVLRFTGRRAPGGQKMEYTECLVTKVARTRVTIEGPYTWPEMYRIDTGYESIKGERRPAQLWIRTRAEYAEENALAAAAAKLSAFGFEITSRARLDLHTSTTLQKLIAVLQADLDQES